MISRLYSNFRPRWNVKLSDVTVSRATISFLWDGQILSEIIILEKNNSLLCPYNYFPLWNCFGILFSFFWYGFLSIKSDKCDFLFVCWKLQKVIWQILFYILLETGCMSGVTIINEGTKIMIYKYIDYLKISALMWHAI